MCRLTVCSSTCRVTGRSHAVLLPVSCANHAVLVPILCANLELLVVMPSALEYDFKNWSVLHQLCFKTVSFSAGLVMQIQLCTHTFWQSHHIGSITLSHICIFIPISHFHNFAVALLVARLKTGIFLAEDLRYISFKGPLTWDGPKSWLRWGSLVLRPRLASLNRLTSR